VGKIDVRRKKLAATIKQGNSKGYLCSLWTSRQVVGCSRVGIRITLLDYLKTITNNPKKKGKGSQGEGVNFYS